MNSSRRGLILGLVIVAIIILTALVTYALVSENDDQPAIQSESSNQQAPKERSNQSQADDTTSNDQTQQVSSQDAERIATDRFGGTVTEIEQDTHNDRPTWEIDIQGSSEGEIEVHVDRETGEIISWERD